MDKTEIVDFIKQKRCAEVAELQLQLGIAYKTAKEVIDEMVSRGELVYAEGVRYNYIEKVKPAESPAFRRRRSVPPEIMIQHIDGEEPDKKPKYRSLREYLEARRKAEEAKEAEDEEDEEDDDDDDDEEDDDGFEWEKNNQLDEELLRKKALKLCIERDSASVSMLQRALPISYIRACNIIDWMESIGYISPTNGPWARKVLITKEDYYQLFPEDRLEDITDTDDGLYKPLGNLHDFDNTAETEVPEDKKPAVINLVNAFNKIAESKRAPVRADTLPCHDLWTNETEFTNTVLERMKRLIKSDKKMGKGGAVRKAETYLEGVRDTHDMKMVQVYERLVYEIKNTSNYLYAQLKKQFCENN